MAITATTELLVRNNVKICYRHVTISEMPVGDHVMTEDGKSSIVVRVGEKMSQLEVAQFPSEDRRGPGLVVINNFTRQSYLHNLHNAYA